MAYWRNLDKLKSGAAFDDLAAFAKSAKLVGLSVFFDTDQDGAFNGLFAVVAENNIEEMEKFANKKNIGIFNVFDYAAEEQAA